MRNGVLGSLSALLLAAGLSQAQTPEIQAQVQSQLQAPQAPAHIVRVPSAVVTDPGNNYQPEVACGDDCCPSNSPRIWFNGEFLMWWTKNTPVPVPLVTTSSTNVPPGGGVLPVGALTAPGTSTVLGGSAIDLGQRYGARFTVGAWIDPNQVLGVEANYFFLGPRSLTQTVTSTGQPGSLSLFVPFFNTTGFPIGIPGESVGPSPFALPVAGPAFGIRGIDQLTVTSRLQGTELNGLFNVFNSGILRVDGLAGFRYLNLLESLTFTTQSMAGLGAAGAVPLFYNTADSYQASNNFYGGQLGGRVAYNLGVLPGLSFSATGKVALGNMNERLNVDGLTLTNIPVAPGQFQGGAFAQPGNIGRQFRNQFVVVPETICTLGYQITNYVRLSFGYNFLYISDVARPGNQIDRNVNITQSGIAQALGITQLPPAQQAFYFHTSSYWAQGMNFGLGFQF